MKAGLVPTTEPVVVEPAGQRAAFPSRLENAACWFEFAGRRSSYREFNLRHSIVLSLESAIREGGGRITPIRLGQSPILRKNPVPESGLANTAPQDHRRHSCQMNHGPITNEPNTTSTADIESRLTRVLAVAASITGPAGSVANHQSPRITLC